MTGGADRSLRRQLADHLTSGAAHLTLLGLSAYDLKVRLDGDYDAIPHDRWATAPAPHDPGPLGTGMVSLEPPHPALGQVTRLSFLRALVRDTPR